MRNKYPGICYRCGQSVPVGAGHFESLPGGGWRVQHASCAIAFRGQPDAVTIARNIGKKIIRAQKDADLAQGTGRKAQRARRRLRMEGT